MAELAPIEKITVNVLGKDVILDPNNMHYNENSLGEFMSKEYAWVDYFGKQLEFAQKEAMLADIEAEAIYSKKFMLSKDDGNSDNYAKAFALSDNDVIEAKKRHIERKEVVGHIKRHLTAWDKNHDNAQNRGHTLRKEMDVLSRDIYSNDSNDVSTYEAY